MFVFLIYIVYLALWFLLVFVSCLIAWRLSKSKKITAIAGVVAFLVMYWPAFGDYIPTWWAHKKLCEKEAEFKVYVTPEQWSKDNPAVLEVLIPYKKFTKIKEGQLHNDRIFSAIHIAETNLSSVKKLDHVFKDIMTKKVIAKKTDFSRGYGSYGVGIDERALKIWLYKTSCFVGDEKITLINEMQKFYKNFKIHWE